MQLSRDVKGRFASVLNKLSEVNASSFSEIIRGKVLSGDVKTLEAAVLGVNYRVEVVDDDVKVFVDDPLNREEDLSRLLVYMLNAVERALEGKIARGEGRLTKLVQLQGYSTAQLYEKRIANFLAAEMDGTHPNDIKGAVRAIGGYLVEHPNATWSFEVSPFNGVRIRVVYWQGEEDMPSNATLLLGEEVKEAAVPVEDLIAIMEMAINRFVLFYRKETGKKPKLYESLYL